MGVQLRNQNASLTPNGVTNTPVIVALGGYAVEDHNQYTFIRKLSRSPDLHLIVWDGSQYKEITAHLPSRIFGTDLIDYSK